MAINDKDLTVVQGLVTDITTTEGDFQIGLDDVMIEINAIQEAFFENVDLANYGSGASVSLNAIRGLDSDVGPDDLNRIGRLEEDNVSREQLALLSQLRPSGANAANMTVLNGLVQTLGNEELNFLDGILTPNDVASSDGEPGVSNAVLNVNDLRKLAGWNGDIIDLQKLNGISATANELNVLDGSTVDTNELNTLNGISTSLGVTVQSQLDDKLDLGDVTPGDGINTSGTSEGSYFADGDGVQTVFTISPAPSGTVDSIVPRLAGIIQTTGFTVDLDTYTVTFSTAPGNFVQVRLDYSSISHPQLTVSVDVDTTQPNDGGLVVGSDGLAHYTPTTVAANVTEADLTYLSGLTFDDLGHVTGTDTQTISEGVGINISTTGVISGEVATSTNAGIASFNADDFAVDSAGNVTIAGTNSIETGNIEDNAVTFAKMQDIPAATLMGNDGTASGDPEALTVSEIRAMLSLEQSDIRGDVDAAGDGLRYNPSTGEFTHADTSSVTDVNEVNLTYLSGLTFDEFGHVETTDTQAISEGDGIDISIAGAISHETPTTVASDVTEANLTYLSGITFDDFGHVATTDTQTISAGSGISIADATGVISHGDTSTQGDLIAANNVFVSGVDLDGAGHIQGFSTQSIQGGNGVDISSNGTISLTATTAGEVVTFTSLAERNAVRPGGEVWNPGDIAVVVDSSGTESFIYIGNAGDTGPTDNSDWAELTFSSLENTTYSFASGTNGGFTVTPAIGANQQADISVSVGHIPISAAAPSSNNSGATFIQDVTVDTHGHVTGFETATIGPGTIGAAASVHTHTASQVSGLATVATSGNFNDLSNQPPVTAITSNGSTPSLNTGITAAEVRNLIGAGTSSFSGAYSALTGTPTIPANPAITTNGSTPSLASGITGAEVRNLIGAGTSSFSGAYSALTGTPTIPTPAITSNGSTPLLNTGISAVEIRNLIGAGTSSTNTTYPSQTQAVWDAGSLGTESVISPSKLSSTIDNIVVIEPESNGDPVASDFANGALFVAQY